MNGFMFASASAVFSALFNILSKYNLKKLNVYYFNLGLFTFASIFSAISLLFTGIPQVDYLYFLNLLGSGILNVIAMIFFFKAIKISEISLITPITAFNPIFIMITGIIIIREFPSYVGLLGVLSIVVGSYILNIEKNNRDYLAPFKAMIRNKGPRYTIIACMLWGFTAVFDKIGMQHSSVIFWIVSLNVFIAISFLFMCLVKKEIKHKTVKDSWSKLLILGLVFVMMQIAQFTAMLVMNLSYALSIKGFSLVLVVLYGHFFMKEKDFKKRIAGTIMMLLGIILIAFA